MLKKVMPLLFLIATLNTINALDGVSVGLRVGADASFSAVKIHGNGTTYRKLTISDAFNQEGVNPFSVGMLLGVFSNLEFNENFTLHIGLNALLFRQYHDDIALDGEELPIKRRIFSHSFDLDLIARLQSNSIQGLYLGLGLGPTLATKPRGSIPSLHLNAPLKRGKIHLGLNILLDMGWSMSISEQDNQFIQLGFRGAFDIIGLTQKKPPKNCHSEVYALMTPVSMGFSVAYLYRFTEEGNW
ncbi:hypothetical protein [Entomospira culicis]|uniref:Outer membrane protein beta-barrel domain-containing protein n=1 Tax=Entomospira culicis TaxID=2719989 RepID=A0A968KWP4_9SPIO|nr:hypothetical protein [Entomospira culicis]NIZ19623.1 hypothetical protein [Entomospira culicis]NIZ69472.1 hypothetical protein [Entomospira culicis]WDI36587.1 hypothetical protein PVA46_04490 [Entomospira culicis]WDI38215.1 hypothetical protein PVA47_04500 [Entomospira culicis]